MFPEVFGWRINDKRFDTELWEFEYDIHRYLKNVSDAAFDRRYSELYHNLYYLISPLRDKFSIQAHFLSSWWWLRKLFHMNYEYRLRDRSPQTPVEAWAVKNIEPSPICVPRCPNACDFVVRYSEEQWLRDFTEHGRVRIAPASSYLGEHLDEARQDDELSKHRYQRGDLVQVTTQNGKLIPIVGDLQRTTSFSVNYFVLCSSSEHDMRLHFAFPSSDGQPAAACAIVWDVEEFARRLELAASSRLQSWYFHHGPVAYFDPYEVRPKEVIDPGTSKDFRYAYQREYRFLWIPLSGGMATEPMFLDLGSLTDIASLYRRDGSLISGRASPNSTL